MRIALEDTHFRLWHYVALVGMHLDMACMRAFDLDPLASRCPELVALLWKCFGYNNHNQGGQSKHCVVAAAADAAAAGAADAVGAAAGAGAAVAAADDVNHSLRTHLIAGWKAKP